MLGWGLLGIFVISALNYVRPNQAIQKYKKTGPEYRTRRRGLPLSGASGIASLKLGFILHAWRGPPPRYRTAETSGLPVSA